MDPEPEQNPTEAPSLVPQPMTMERSPSSESGSNSSVSTVYFTKKSGSASSSRSAASTSRSPPREGESRPLSWQSPSDTQGQGEGQGQGQDEGGDHPPETVLPNAEVEKKNGSKSPVKLDSTRSFEQVKGGPTALEALKKSSDNIVHEVARTESLMIKDAEEAADNCCCSCCRRCCGNCTTWGIAGDIFSILCCPITIFTLLSCMCCRCPKLFARKTKREVKTIQARRKGEEPHVNKEESGLESTDTAKEASPRAAAVKNTQKVEVHRNEKPEPEGETFLKSPGSHSQKMNIAQGFDAQHNFFFPSPELEDDHPGGDKPGGR